MSYSTGAELSKRRWNTIPIEDALQKTYLVRARAKAGGIVGFPACLVGKRFNIVLVKGEGAK